MTTTEVWRDPRFRRYWLGQGISEIGDRVSELALPLVAILLLDARPIEVGALVAAVWAPNLLAVLVGTWVDQQPSKRRLLILANLVQGAAIGLVPVCYAAGWLSMPLLYAVALAGGLGGVIVQTAYPAFFVQLVSQDQYVEANSLLSTTRSASFIAGPPAAGGLVKVLGAPVALLVDAGSFFVSAAMIARVRVVERPVPTEKDGSFWARVRGGIGYLWRHAYLRASLACASTLNFFTIMVQAVLILFATRELDLGPGAIGLALGVGATGGLVGAVFAGRIGRLIGAGPTIAVGCVMFSLGFGVLPFVLDASLPLRLGALALAEFVSGVGVMLFDVNLNSLQTAVIDDRMRSRTSGAFATVNYGIRPLGALAGGASAELIGLPTTIVLGSVAGAMAVLWLLPSPILRVRRIDELPSIAP